MTTAMKARRRSEVGKPAPLMRAFIKRSNSNWVIPRRGEAEEVTLDRRVRCFITVGGVAGHRIVRQIDHAIGEASKAIVQYQDTAADELKEAVLDWRRLSKRMNAMSPGDPNRRAVVDRVGAALTRVCALADAMEGHG